MSPLKPKSLKMAWWLYFSAIHRSKRGLRLYRLSYKTSTPHIHGFTVCLPPSESNSQPSGPSFFPWPRPTGLPAGQSTPAGWFALTPETTELCQAWVWQLWWCPGISVASLGQQGLVCNFLWQTSTLPCALLWRGEEVDCVLCWKFQVDSCWCCGGGGDVVMELTIPVVSPDPCRAAMNVLLLAEVTNRWVSQARAEQIPFKFLVREVIVTVNSIPIITSNCYWIAQML